MSAIRSGGWRFFQLIAVAVFGLAVGYSLRAPLVSAGTPAKCPTVVKAPLNLPDFFKKFCNFETAVNTRLASLEERVTEIEQELENGCPCGETTGGSIDGAVDGKDGGGLDAPSGTTGGKDGIG